MRRHAKALLVVLVAMLTLGASAAFALQTHVRGSDLDTGAISGGTYWFLGAEVDPDSGDLYATDQWDPSTFAFGYLHRFNSDGSYDTGFNVEESLSEPQDVAIDNTGTATDGRIYIAEAGANRITAIDSSGALDAGFGAGGRINGVEDTPGDPDAIPAPPGALSRPCGLAIDQASGDLYVADSNNSRVWIFDSSGAYKGKIADSAISYPCGIAFGSGNALYIRNSGDGRVLRFAPEGSATYAFHSVLYAPVEPDPWASDVATDSAGHIYVDKGDRITEYDGEGNLIVTFGQGEIFSSSAIAVDSSSGDVYAAENGSIHRFGPLVTLPDAVTGEASAVTDETATLSGSVDPAGGPEAGCVFEYGIALSEGFAYTDSVPCEPAGSYSTPQDVTAHLTNLLPATTYNYRLVSANAHGQSFGPGRKFRTYASPTLGLQRGTSSDQLAFVIDVTADSATLGSVINPNGAETTYRFEYVTDAQYEATGFIGAATTPSTTLSGFEEIKVLAPVTGLQPATTYRYRVVASNAFGEVEHERVFKTNNLTGAIAPGLYPGQNFLPEERAWEMVTPPDKNGGKMRTLGGMTFVSDDGEKVLYKASASFGDTEGNGGLGDVQYLGTRGAQGWDETSVTPRPNPAHSQLFGVGLTTVYPSPDFSRTAVVAYDLPYVDDDYPEGAYNIYRGAVGSEQLAPLTPKPVSPTVLDAFAEQHFIGGSSDFSRMYFRSPLKLLPEATGPGRFIYEWSEGDLALASVLPDGSTPVNGATTATDVTLVATDRLENLRENVSADGKLLFTARGSSDVPQLYMRVGGDETIWLARPEITPEPAALTRTEFQVATPDFSTVLFTTETRLNEEDPGGPGVALYAYRESASPDTDQNLEFITRRSSNIVALSIADDGNSGFFGNGGAQSPLWYWDRSEVRTIRSERTLDAAAQHRRGIYFVQGSADGQRLAFLSEWEIADSGDVNQFSNFAHQAYVYDLGRDEFICVSCPRSGAEASSRAHIAPASVATNNLGTILVDPRTITRDGRLVFFSTKTPLVPGDVNGQMDAYAYDVDKGEAMLISSGRSNAESWYVNASADGDDIFFFTSERLSAWDVDGASDVYDARVGGGLDEPTTPAPSCQGDACQPPPRSLNDPTPASSALITGTTPKVRCLGRKVRRRGRCVKPRSKAKHGRNRPGKGPGARANRNGRAGK